MGTIVDTVEPITPELAEKYLEFNATNRPIKKGLWVRYGRDMLAGDWHLSHEGIAFYSDNALADGQHRLLGIIEAGVPVLMRVFRGLDRRAALNIDTGLPRTAHDGYAVAGLDWSRRLVQAGTFLAQTIQKSRTKLTRAELAVVISQHREALEYAIAVLPGQRTGLCQVSVLGALARAYYQENRGELKRFAEILGTGMDAGPEDRAALLLRNAIIAGLLTRASGQQFLMYRKTERALRAFLDREPLTKLYAAPEELFPLPESEEKT